MDLTRAQMRMISEESGEIYDICNAMEILLGQQDSSDMKGLARIFELIKDKNSRVHDALHDFRKTDST